MPELGGSVTQAKLSAWLKQEGDRVSRGQPIAEVETDKTNVEVEAPDDGVLARIHVSAGTDGVAVNDLLAVILAEGSVADAPQPVAPNGSASVLPAAERPAPAPASAAQREPRGDPRPVPRGPSSSRTVAADAASSGEPLDADVPASPMARRMAYAAGLSLVTIKGSGPGGRITKADVDKALGPRQERVSLPPRAGATTTPLPDDDPSEYDVSALSTMRRVSAERLTLSKQTIPHFYLSADCAMDAVARIRADINARGSEPVSITAFVLRATALALRKVPAANAMWADGAVRRYKAVNLAVAVNTPSGLIAPVIRNAADKSVAALNGELRGLAERAREGRLKPDDYGGGTCTVSNLGMFGVTSLFPIINPPQACILGFGAIEERPVVRDHAVAIGQVMTCTLSADHRALDGAGGAELLAAFRQFIEDPWSLLL